MRLKCVILHILYQISNRSRVKEAMKRGDARVALAAIYRFIDNWFQAVQSDNSDNGSQILIHCKNLKSYYLETSRSMVDELQSMIERFSILRLL